MKLVAQGEASAFRALSDRLLPRVLRFCKRLSGNASEAEEIAQETFLRAWQHAERYQPRAQVITWLLTIARNLAIDRGRRLGRQPATTSEADPPGSSRPSSILERKQAIQGVQRALEALPERQRAAILLAHFEELPSSEGSRVIGVGVRAYESLLARGRRALREALENTEAALHAGGTAAAQPEGSPTRDDRKLPPHPSGATRDLPQ